MPVKLVLDSDRGSFLHFSFFLYTFPFAFFLLTFQFAFYLLTFYFLKLINQFEAILQNKPNLPNALMNVNTIKTKDYENKRLRRCVKTNPIQTQYKANTNPIPERPKMNENLFATRVYENITTFRPQKNKPNSNPILSAIALAKPNQTQPVVSLSAEFVVFSLNLAETYSDIIFWNA